MRAALAIFLALALSRAASLERAQKLLWNYRYRDAAVIYRDLLRRAPGDEVRPRAVSV